MEDNLPHRRVVTGAAIFAIAANLLVLGAPTIGCQKEQDAGRPQDGGNERRKRTARTKKPNKTNAGRKVIWEDVEGRTVLLITHPTVRVVRSFGHLVEKGILSADSLLMVGVYHADEWKDYSKARRYAQRHGMEWMAFEELTCSLTEEQIFRKNGCTGSFTKLASRASGMIFTGGPDIPPSIYGEGTRLTTVIRDPHRQWWEISFLFHLLGSSRAPDFRPLMKDRPSLPVLAICMGLQAMNVATGGSLVQDIPSEIYRVETFEALLSRPADTVHRNPRYRLYPAPDMWPGVFHTIRFTGGSEVWKAMSAPQQGGRPTTVEVMSIHHQAAEKLGEGLEVAATSMDGKVIEAVHHERYPHVLGVQFHPEYDVIWDPTRTAKLHTDHPDKNHFAARLREKAETMRFHRSFWRVFGGWLEGKGREHPGSRRATGRKR
jgi:putative glutamine amidotransferase